MTLQEFLKELGTTPREWKILRGNIRQGLHCPISMIANSFRYFGDAASAYYLGEKIGLQKKTIDRIMAAADNYLLKKKEDLSLRERLLKACGL